MDYDAKTQKIWNEEETHYVCDPDHDRLFVIEMTELVTPSIDHFVAQSWNRWWNILVATETLTSIAQVEISLEMGDQRIKPKINRSLDAFDIRFHHIHKFHMPSNFDYVAVSLETDNSL